MRFARNSSLVVMGACAFFGSMGVAEAASCSSTGANQITCIGGANVNGANVVVTGTGSPVPGTVHANHYPATLDFSGAPAGATVSSVVLRLNGYTTLSQGSGDVGIVFEGPLSGASKPNLQVVRGGGTPSTHQTGATLVLQDGGTLIPDPNSDWSANGTFKPTARDGTSRDGEPSPVYSPTGPSSISSAAPLGSSTLTSVFAGKTVNGTWSVYLASDSGSGPFGLSSNISFSSFDVIINYSGATTPSTTVLTPNPTTAFTSSPNNSVTLSATVTAGATGTVTFKEGASSLPGTCASAIAISGSSASCTTTFSTEGVHTLTATYSGDGTFVTSAGTANVYIQNHSGNTGTTYCNTGAINANGTSDITYASTTPYPSSIVIGDGVNTSITGSVNTVSLKLTNFSTPNAGTLAGVHMLLVAPDNTHAFDFFSNTGNSASAGNYIFQDGSGQVGNGPIGPGTYGPTAIGPPPDSFTPGPPAPAPQVPGSFVYAAPIGSSTFQTAFSGASVAGAWKLFMYNFIGSGINATAAGGWCITVSLATGHPTTTTVTSSANPNAVLGAAVQFTATVASSPTPSVGTVTFTENGSPLAGAPNSGVVSVSGGVAAISTSGLPEGDHTITASYHDSTSVFNDSFGTITIRIDKATSTPTLSGSTWSYCNTGVVTIPAGNITLTNIGPAGPNPTNVMVTNMPGTISSTSVTLNGFSFAFASGRSLQSLLVGPNGASAPATAQTLDFFSNAGGTNPFGPANVTFTDAGAKVTGALAAGNNGPTAFSPIPTFTSSSFFTLPGTFQHAPDLGAFNFNQASGGVYRNTLPNGVWSLYFNQTSHNTATGGMSGGWCMNFIVNPVTGTGTTSHVGPQPSNHMKQGGTGTVSFSLHNNGDANSKGSTGDPDGNHGMVVTGSLPAGLTLGTVPTGTPWACIANTTVQFTCKSSSAIAQGSNYPLLTLPVAVAGAATASVTVSGVTFTGAGMTGGTFASDTIIIDPAPILAITKTHTGTFTQSGTGIWNLLVQNNSATASGGTDGSTVTVSDALPSGYTVNSASGTNWACSGSTTVTCTSTQVVVGNGGQFPFIQLVVNIPANSPVSVTNTGKVFGGGDLTHTSQGTAATGADTVTVVQVPATISLTAGNNQSVAVNTAYPTNLSVTVLDAGSVAINGVTVTFTAPASGASGTFSGGTNVKTAVTAGAGVATATIYTANTVAGGPYNINVAAGSISNNFSETNLSGTATQMTANPGTTPQSTNVNTAFATALGVTVKDALNNPVSGVTVTFTAPSSGASGKFAGNVTTIPVITTSTGVASAPFTANGTGGAYTVTAAAPTLTTVNFSLTNTGGTATHFSVSATSPQTAGTAFNYTVTALDAGNNLASTYTGTVHFTSSDPLAMLPTDYTFLAGDSGAKLFSATLKTAGSRTITATDTVSGSITGTSGGITVNASTAVSLTLTAPGTATSGTPISVQVTAKDAFSNTANSYSGIVHFTSSDGQATLPANSVLTAGVGTFSVTLKTAGASTVTGTDTVTSSITGTTSSIVVSAGAATQVSANPGTSPQSTLVNTAFTTPLSVTVKDANNNVVAGVSVTFATPSSGASATFTGGVTSLIVPTNSSGIATAAATANATPGGAYTATATVTGLPVVNFSLTNTSAGPQITQNPTDQTVNAGQTATFTAAASGTPTPTVQWQFSTDGGATFNNVAGATTTTLTRSNVLASDNGTKFRAVFTNSGGSATTTAATMTVNFAPSITTNPTSQSVAASSTATFVAAASGNPTPTVQWQISTNGGGTFANIAGATSTTLSFTAQSTDNGNQYRAVFTNSVGNATTTSATLTVTAGPQITQNPTDQTVNAGQTATFTAAATGTPTPTVQWQFSTDGGATFNNSPGATTTTLTVPGVTAGQNGTKYRAVFTNASGSATTTAATLTVNFAPSITTNPTSQSVAASSTATFVAAASGNPTPTVQWQISTNGGGTFANIAGATSTTLSFTAQSTDNGNQYRAVFTNSVGSATTTSATLTVTAGPQITQNPTDQTVNATQTATFTAAATGTPTPTVQWQFSTDGGASFNNVGGATTTTLTVSNTQASQNGTKYRAVFTNASGSATTTAATLTVHFAPAITTNPTSQSVAASSTATFVAAASGNPTPTVQWQISTNGGGTFNNIAGATSTTLSFTAQVSDNGNQYRAVFTNSVGNATTTSATLTVTAGPLITLNPTDQTVNPGATATFTANATGTPNPTVQWQVSTNGGGTFTDLGGATSTTLSLPGVTVAMNGNKYRAVFTNVSGSATTTAATLTVNAVPAVVAFKVLWGNTSYNVTGSARNRLPWQITGIQVVFSAVITQGNINSLAGVTPTGFSGLGTNTLTWTITPVSLGQLTATLAGTGPNALADGNGTTLGNGAGASQLLRVLYGDYNDDGIVNALDQTAVLAIARGQPYDVFADMNGDGLVNTTDVTLVRAQIGNTLP